MAQLIRRKNHPPIALAACASILLILVFLKVSGLPALSQGVEIVPANASDVEANIDEIDEQPTEPLDSSPEPLRDDVSPSELVIHVDGAVAQPGVYKLSEGARVSDAVAAAGGLGDDADISAINLAAKVSDGIKIYIPLQGENSPQIIDFSAQPDSASTDFTREGSPALININTATGVELMELSGVGEATAKAIIEDRESFGPFSSIEDLMRVSGIGEKKFARIKDKICV